MSARPNVLFYQPVNEPLQIDNNHSITVSKVNKRYKKSKQLIQFFMTRDDTRYETRSKTF